MTLTDHQKEQIKIVDSIETSLKNNSNKLSTVEPVQDFEGDNRICLTALHFPHENHIQKIQKLLTPLKEIEPNFYYYSDSSLHMTIKNVRVIADPPKFNTEDIEKARKVFSKVVPAHRQYNTYFYRLFLFPTSLALIGTTDPEHDNLVLNLDQELTNAGVPDDKQYANSSHFFINMSLARFMNEPSEEFKRTVENINKTLHFDPYTIDSVSLLTCNAVVKKLHIIETWKLKEKN